MNELVVFCAVAGGGLLLAVAIGEDLKWWRGKKR